MSNYTYIDLFAGGGGLSEGFIRQGFLPVAHVEYDEAACYTLKTRTVYHQLKSQGNLDKYCSYLKGEIKRKDLYSEVDDGILNSIINAEIGRDNRSIFARIDSLLGDKRVDLVIGGPPCQAYSTVGRAPLKNKAVDNRKTLYIQYGRFLSRYNPKLFVFENVPGLLSAEGGKYYRNLQKYYRRLGYQVEAKELNAYNYGVVQNRERIFIIGWRKELDLQYPEIPASGKRYYRDDIFYDLPPVTSGDSNRLHYYSAPVNTYLTESEIRNGVGFITQHVTRPHNNNDLSIYRLAIQMLENGERIKNNLIPEDLRTQQNVTDFLDRFKVVGKEPHTMIAHIAKDGHHFIHPDIEQLRSISVREAARIQSFPDDYYFEGQKENRNRSAAFRQIGNAVPPLMAEKIAEKIKEMLNG